MLSQKKLRATSYIISEILPSLILGVISFLGILIMLRFLKLTEFILVQGVSTQTAGKLLLYMSVGFLPVILPISTLFSILMTYGRLSNDSEITAFRSVGYSMWDLTFPALILGIALSVLSAQTSFYIGPWGSRSFEALITELGSKKVASSIREGTFAEGFYNLVVYSNKVDAQKNYLKDVFIYDERSSNFPVTIISKEGQVIHNPGDSGTLLRLKNGSIHKPSDGVYTKINFDKYDIFLDPMLRNFEKKSNKGLSIDDIKRTLNEENLPPQIERRLRSEYHKRWSLTFACIIFSLFGVALGTITQNREKKNNSFVLSIAVVATYWIAQIAMESVARKGQIPVPIAIWFPSLLFFILSLVLFRKLWRV